MNGRSKTMKIIYCNHTTKIICSQLVLDCSTVAGGHASFSVRILMIVCLHRELYGVNDYVHTILGLKLSNVFIFLHFMCA